MNRHTLYSAAVSVMIVDQDHYINAVFHEPGEHDLAVEQFGTSFVLVACRILVDPDEPTDVATVNTLQDQLRRRQRRWILYAT